MQLVRSTNPNKDTHTRRRTVEEQTVVSQIPLLKTAILLLYLWCPTVVAETARVHLHVEVTPSSSKLIDEVTVALLPKTSELRSLLNQAPIDVAITQKDAQFQPFVTMVQRGASVDFPNLDAFAHHVYSFSKAMAFELPLYSGDDVQRVTATNPGVVPLGCNIHDWMLGYILVVDSPFFGFLENGRAQFPKVPVGNYSVALWHPSMKKPWQQDLAVSKQRIKHQLQLPNKLRRVRPRPSPLGHDLEDY